MLFLQIVLFRLFVYFSMRFFALIVFSLFFFGCVAVTESVSPTPSSEKDVLLQEYLSLLEKGKTASYAASYSFSGDYFESPGGISSFSVYVKGNDFRADYGKKSGVESFFIVGKKSIVCNPKCSESSFSRELFDERRPDRYFDRELFSPTSGSVIVESAGKVFAGVKTNCFNFENARQTWSGIHCLEKNSGAPLYFEVRDSRTEYSSGVMRATRFSSSVSDKDLTPGDAAVVEPVNPSGGLFDPLAGSGLSIPAGGLDIPSSTTIPLDLGFGVSSTPTVKSSSASGVLVSTYSIPAPLLPKTLVKRVFQGKFFPQGDVYLLDKWTVAKSGVSAFVEELNSERLKRGLSSLAFVDSSSAQVKAEDMVSKNYFTHNSPTGLAAGLNFDVSPNLLYSSFGGTGAVEENLAHFTNGKCSFTPLEDGFSSESVIQAENLARDVVQGFIYRDEASGNGHRDSLLSPCMNSVGVGLDWKTLDSRGGYSCKLSAHLAGNHVKWVKHPAVENGVFKASGFVDKRFSLDTSGAVFFVSAEDISKMHDNYSVGKQVAGIALEGYVFDNVKTITAEKLDFRASDGFFEVEFVLDLPQKSGVYTVSFAGKDLERVKHPFKQDWGYSCALFDYAFPVAG